MELENPGGYPAALLGDVRVNFFHYASFAEGAARWEERKRKINWTRLVLIATDRGSCDYETLMRFDRLPCPYKVIFTHRSCPEISSAVYIKGFENCGQVGILTDFKRGLLMRRYLDALTMWAFSTASSNSRSANALFPPDKVENTADKAQTPVASQAEENQKAPLVPCAALPVVPHRLPEDLIAPEPPAHLSLLPKGRRIPRAEHTPEQE